MGGICDFAPNAIEKELSRVNWETRYGGALSVAVIDAATVAGVSGPWPDGSYALTWWSTQRLAVLPTLEFHNSMEEAKSRVESLADQLNGLVFETAVQPH